MHNSIERWPGPATTTVGFTMRSYLIAFALSASACPHAYGQKLETSFAFDFVGVRSLQPNVVRMSARDQGTGFGGKEAGVQFQLARPITKWLAWRADAGYMFGRHRFELPCKCITPGDRTIVIENDLTIHSARAIAGVELRTPREQYWFTGFRVGLEAVIAARRDAEYSMRFSGHRPDTALVLVTDERYALRSGLGLFMPQLELSVGRQFWKWRPSRIELVIRQDLNSHAYGLMNMQGVSQNVQLRRTSIGVRVSVLLTQVAK